MTVSQKVEFLLREKWGQEIERNSVPDKFRATPVYFQNAYQWEVFVVLAWRTDLSSHCVSIFQGICFYLLGRYIDIVRAVQIVVVGTAQETVSVRHKFQNASGLNCAFVFD